TASAGERPQHGAYLFLRREGERGEVPPDRGVLGTGQQHHLCRRHRPAGPADLLVVRDRGGRRAQVHHEPEVRLVETHPQGGGGDQRLHPVVPQVRLGGAPVTVLVLTGVRGHGVPAGAQEGRGLAGGGDGQGVDDAGARQGGQVVGEPGQPVRRGGQGDHRQAQ